MKKLLIAVTFATILLSGCSVESKTATGVVSKSRAVAVEVQSTSDKNFERDVLKSKEPVLVDFYATWCPPCRHMSPIVDEVAGENAGKVKVFKVDVDQNPMLSQALGIESIPTFVVFKDGHPVIASQGAIPKTELLSMIESAFAPNLAGQKAKTAI
jgi:thioredoxin 1